MNNNAILNDIHNPRQWEPTQLGQNRTLNTEQRHIKLYYSKGYLDFAFSESETIFITARLFVTYSMFLYFVPHNIEKVNKMENAAKGPVGQSLTGGLKLR